MALSTHALLKAFTPSRESYDADQLKYKNLRTVFQIYSLPALIMNNTRRLLPDKDTPSITEIKRQVNIVSIINASYRLQKSFTPVDKYFWSKVFTTSSVKLFGKPKKKELSQLVDSEIRFLESAAASLQQEEFIEPVLVAYRTLFHKSADATKITNQKYLPLMKEIQNYFNDEYKDVFVCFDNYPSTHHFSPTDVVNVFNEALKVLAIADKSWNEWHVELGDSAHLSVNSYRQTIRVGKYRAAISHNQIKGLFAHEVLIHAQRGLNGAKISKELSTGLDDYLVAEEGFGVLVEASINGQIPEKIKDRYIDIALALGTKWHRPMTREELYEICYRRSIIRSTASDEDIDQNVLEQTTWEHVNRIYRGSLGNKYVGVFTKDVAYYQGFIKLTRHFEKARKKGVLHSQIRYALQGKFDPTNR